MEFRKVLFTVMLMAAAAGGCGRGVDVHTSRKEIAYTICKEEQLPPELQKKIREKAKKACTFSFHDTRYTYLAVCYGRKKYMGYSIRVEECSRGDQVLYLRTQLVGPSAKEPVLQQENTPWIIVRCDRTEDFCMIEP